MTPERRREIEAHFDAAVERPAAERAAYLAEACGADPGLLAEVRALLEAHDQAGSLLDRGPLGAALGGAGRSGGGGAGGGYAAPERIGPYRLLGEIGRGGMSVVYLAERDDGQFRRRVALKVIRGGEDEADLHERIVAERQILASLDHPSIARLFDGGVTEDGRPYLVMEYVGGLPIDVYCDRMRLSIPERLRLFALVCRAVDHAHRNLIVHRDLKPSNILVTPNGEVKLLDFGIAKLLNPALGVLPAPFTRSDLRVLTPEYASPEQVRGEAITTTSDVYALGVILYELLTGRHPYRETARTIPDLVRAICETEAERPSTRVARWALGRARGGMVPDRGGMAPALAPGESAGDAAASATTPEAVAADRQTTPERLRRTLRGDLDAIVLLALRKEPARRYGSAEALAQDIERSLDGLAVQAHRGSRWYRIGKLARRHRLETAALALVVLSLLAGAGIAAWQARIARGERDRAAAALARAQQALRQSEEVTGFLIGLFEASDPAAAVGVEITARDLLRRGARRAESLGDEPVVQARMLDVMGRVYRNLGDYAEARALIERALDLRRADRDLPEVPRTLRDLADVLRLQGHYAEAEARARQALEIQERLLGPDHPDLAPTLTQLAGLAVYGGDLRVSEAFARRAVRIVESTAEPDEVLLGQSLITLGSVLRRRGVYNEAEASYRRAIALLRRRLGSQHPDVASAMVSLATIENSFDRFGAAESLYRQVLEIRRRTFGEGHEMVAHATGDLAHALAAQGEFVEAIRLMRQSLAILGRVLGTEHPTVQSRRVNLAMVLGRAGSVVEADSTFRDAIAGIRRLLGDEHANVANAQSAYAEFLTETGRYAEAEAMFRTAIASGVRAAGREIPLTGLRRGMLATALVRQGRFEEAETTLRQALEITGEFGIREEHADVRQLLLRFVDLYEAWGRPEDAARYRARAGTS